MNGLETHNSIDEGLVFLQDSWGGRDVERDHDGRDVGQDIDIWRVVEEAGQAGVEGAGPGEDEAERLVDKVEAMEDGGPGKSPAGEDGF